MRPLIFLISFLFTQIAHASSYFVGLASFKNSVNAQAFVSKKGSDLGPVSIRQVRTDSSTFYRVVIGPYPDEAAGRAAVRASQARGMIGAWLVVETQPQRITKTDPQRVADPTPTRVSNTIGSTTPLAAAPATDSVVANAPQKKEQAETLRVLTPRGAPLTLTRIDRDKVKIDGWVDEAIWNSVPIVDDFVVIEPDTGEQGIYDTHLRMAYDERGLLVSVTMSQPVGTLVKRLTGRDLRDNRDSVSITIDTSGEGRYGYWFGINLGDSLMDGTVLPERQFMSDWDGPWYGRTQTTDKGWSAEMFIPWGMVSMPTSEDIRTMGVYVSRKVAHLDERWAWPALPSTQPRFMTALQELKMDGVKPRQQYSVYPFVSSSYDRIDEEVENRVGADILWRPSSNFQLNATVNPDFGNVESDEVIINLTATETFFPEKRLFFLEGQEIFIASPRADTRDHGVGMRGLPYTMVNTRRIGGKPLPPVVLPGIEVPEREKVQQSELVGAVRTTGQAGNFRYGLMAAFEDDVKFDAFDAGQPRNIHQAGNDYGIARLMYEDRSRDGAYRAIGVLSTAVLNSELGDALVQGLDWHYLSAEGNVKIDGQVMSSDLDRVAQRGYGGFLDFELYYADGVRHRIGLEYFDEHIDINDLGFLQRNDEYSIRSAFTVTRSNMSWLRENQFDIRGSVRKNLSEDLTIGTGVYVSNRARLNNLSQLTLRGAYSTPYFDDLNSFGNGSFRLKSKRSANFVWATDTTKPLSLSIGGGYEEDDLGDPGYTGDLGLLWRLGHQYALEFKVGYKDKRAWLLHQDNDLFATFDSEQWLPSLSLEYYISARQQLRLALQWVGIRAEENEFFRIPSKPGDLLQVTKPTGAGARTNYDFSVSQYSLQARYRWEIAPLSDLFLVYTRQASLRDALGNAGFNDLFDHAWENPLADIFVMKIRYRFGS